MCKESTLFMYVSNADTPVYLKIPNLFHMGNCDTYLHSLNNTNGITRLKTSNKNSVLTNLQYTVSHQEIHDGLVRSKSQIHYALHYLPLNTNHHHLLALDMMPS
jgi:hypothetical protein